MSYVESLLSTHESVLRQAHRHPLVLARSIVESAILTVFGALLATGIGIVLPNIVPLPSPFDWLVLLAAASPFVVAIVNLVHEYLRWRCDVVVLTNRRLISVTGILNKSTFDASLSKINDLRLEHSFIGQRLGYGHLTVMTAADTENGELRMEMLRDAPELKRELLEAKDRLEHGND